MKSKIISTHMKSAGRLRIVDGQQIATVSPLAHPETFASMNELQIVEIKREPVSLYQGLNIVVMYADKNGQHGVVAGTITHERDDHAATVVEDIDFMDPAEAETYLHLSVEELFGTNAGTMRRELLKAVA